MSERPHDRLEWRPLGYHPDNPPRDMTPVWAKIVGLVIVNILFSLAFIRYLKTGDGNSTLVYFYPLQIVFGIYLLTEVAFNWRHEKIAGRASSLILSFILISLGVYFLLQL